MFSQDPFLSEQISGIAWRTNTVSSVFNDMARQVSVLAHTACFLRAQNEEYRQRIVDLMEVAERPGKRFPEGAGLDDEEAELGGREEVPGPDDVSSSGGGAGERVDFGCQACGGLEEEEQERSVCSVGCQTEKEEDEERKGQRAVTARSSSVGCQASSEFVVDTRRQAKVGFMCTHLVRSQVRDLQTELAELQGSMAVLQEREAARVLGLRDVVQRTDARMSALAKRLSERERVVAEREAAMRKWEQQRGALEEAARRELAQQIASAKATQTRAEHQLREVQEREQITRRWEEALGLREEELRAMKTAFQLTERRQQQQRQGEQAVGAPEAVVGALQALIAELGAVREGWAAETTALSRLVSVQAVSVTSLREQVRQHKEALCVHLALSKATTAAVKAERRQAAFGSRTVQRLPETPEEAAAIGFLWSDVCEVRRLRALDDERRAAKPMSPLPSSSSSQSSAAVSAKPVRKGGKKGRAAARQRVGEEGGMPVMGYDAEDILNIEVRKSLTLSIDKFSIVSEVEDQRSGAGPKVMLRALQPVQLRNALVNLGRMYAHMYELFGQMHGDMKRFENTLKHLASRIGPISNARYNSVMSLLNLQLGVSTDEVEHLGHRVGRLRGREGAVKREALEFMRNHLVLFTSENAELLNRMDSEEITTALNAPVVNTPEMDNEFRACFESFLSRTASAEPSTGEDNGADGGAEGAEDEDNGGEALLEQVVEEEGAEQAGGAVKVSMSASMLEALLNKAARCGAATRRRRRVWQTEDAEAGGGYWSSSSSGSE